MISPELIEKVSLYLRGRLTWSQLDEWLAPRLADYLSDPNSEDAHLIRILEHDLAEMDDEILDEEQLKEDLRHIVFKGAQGRFKMESPPPEPRASANQTVIGPQLVLKVAVAQYEGGQLTIGTWHSGT
jgi:hypothetical protein